MIFRGISAGLVGVWTTAFSAIFAADSSGSAGTLELSWSTLLLGYGPLGVFAIFVGIDKIGNHSERNRLRILNDKKDQQIADLHEKIENDVVPALVQFATAYQDGQKALENAITVIQEISTTGFDEAVKKILDELRAAKELPSPKPRSKRSE